MTIEQEQKLREQLDQLHDWPDVYMFKFIVPNDAKKKEAVLAEFSSNAKIATRDSKNGNYTSITIKEVMMNVDKIIERYRTLGAIEGLISL